MELILYGTRYCKYFNGDNITYGLENNEYFGLYNRLRLMICSNNFIFI